MLGMRRWGAGGVMSVDRGGLGLRNVGRRMEVAVGDIGGWWFSTDLKLIVASGFLSLRCDMICGTYMIFIKRSALNVAH